MTDLLDQYQDIRTKLTDERKALLARVALIDKALAGGASTPGAKKDVPKEARPGTLTDAILQAVTTGPATIKELQAALPTYPPKSVDTTVRQMAAGGRLSKDDSTPRKFGLPSQS